MVHWQGIGIALWRGALQLYISWTNQFLMIQVWEYSLFFSFCQDHVAFISKEAARINIFCVALYNKYRKCFCEKLSSKPASARLFDAEQLGPHNYLPSAFWKTKTYGKFLCFLFRRKRENLARTKANSVKKNSAWTLFCSDANWHRIFSIIIYLTRDIKFKQDIAPVWPFANTRMVE